MQKDLIPVIPAHFRNFCTRFYFLAFHNQALAVVCVRTEKLVTVFDDDELAISNQSTTTVDHLTRRSSNNGLSFLSADIYALPGTVISLEIADNTSAGGPLPRGRIAACPCFGRLGPTACCAGLWCLRGGRACCAGLWCLQRSRACCLPTADVAA